ncbi:hypothetical protein [Steroidobacter agaridevorans]|uniref:hypothetical protein n=1 Tax=Steroidobacter agaridevorans TaxID=2695856 RepID=UPI00137958E9|nr:hypothetical protein [Steroidobacter agaridevorans]
MTKLKAVLEEAGIADHEPYVYEEQAQKEPGAILETVTLFRAIQQEMLGRDRADWLDLFAKNISQRQSGQSPFHEAICAVAASNVDRSALIEVIRYFQSHMVYFFLNIHDGTRPVRHEDEGLTFRLAYEDRAGYADDDYDRKIDRMRLLPDELHALYENFLTDSGDDFLSRY